MFKILNLEGRSGETIRHCDLVLARHEASCIGTNVSYSEHGEALTMTSSANREASDF